jgi:hypothetical protein
MPENTKHVYEVESLDSNVKGLTGYVIKCRLAKDRGVAEKRMVIFSICCLILSAYFFAKFANLV